MVRAGLLTFFSGVCLFMLTGCPGYGDRLRPDETSRVSKKGESVCFNVDNAQDYQPVAIGINPRGTPPRDKDFTFSTNLTVTNDELCIPSFFYKFPDKGQFVIEYVLKSKKHRSEPRSVVVVVEFNGRQIVNLPPTDREIIRPYSDVK